MNVQTLQQLLNEKVPLTRSMGVQVRRCDREEVRLRAPLDLNKNHKNTVFGGSLTGSQALCCWAWIMNLLEEEGLQAHVVIQESHNRFLKPVDRDFEASCEAPEPKNLERFLKILRQKKRARLALTSEIVNQGERAVIFEGQYVAQLKD